MSEEKNLNMREMTDEELEKASGGGYYWPVTGCPQGYTQFVKWVFVDYIAGDACRSCPNYETASKIGYDDFGYECTEYYKKCRLAASDYVWE